jgi:hypothetical protein
MIRVAELKEVSLQKDKGCWALGGVPPKGSTDYDVKKKYKLPPYYQLLPGWELKFN